MRSVPFATLVTFFSLSLRGRRNVVAVACWKLCVTALIALVMAIPAEGAGPARNGLIAYSGVVTENALAEIYAVPLSGGPRVDCERVTRRTPQRTR